MHATDIAQLHKIAAMDRAWLARNGRRHRLRLARRVELDELTMHWDLDIADGDEVWVAVRLTSEGTLHRVFYIAEDEIHDDSEAAAMAAFAELGSGGIQTVEIDLRRWAA